MWRGRVAGSLDGGEEVCGGCAVEVEHGVGVLAQQAGGARGGEGAEEGGADGGGLAWAGDSADEGGSGEEGGAG